MFEEKAIYSLITALGEGKDTAEAEKDIAKELPKYIESDVFYKIPLPFIVKITKAYKKEFTFEQAKTLLSKCSKENGTETVLLLPYIKLDKMSQKSSVDLLNCIEGVPLFKELNNNAPDTNKPHVEPTKVFVDFPSNANVQLVFRPGTNK